MNTTQSKRMCMCCNKETTWQYNKNIGHSICQKCGNHYSGINTAERIINGTKSPKPFKKAWMFGYEKKPKLNYGGKKDEQNRKSKDNSRGIKTNVPK